ncbi:transcription factor TFIIIB component B'' homolog [Prionailurus viverrinus]|uniref:transcription factor TFIIIB component B'' homolog n=1 Tax=Prionailurus viverrinus TaxID=61388 RepID=UPI001FF34651|nr:transcription factor TFIIIB component B'' homolog [Prionailurus viverrinus]XP_047718949.1 transcription factor TFIIIB component B'' homolog [Prionailurus viverrinus]
MFRRARLSVKPNVRPGVGARSSSAPNPQRGQEAPRPPDTAAASSPKPAESTDVPPVDFGGTEPQENPPRSSDEKTDNENYVEESSKSSSAVSQRRKRISSTTLVKPGVSVPSESHPLSTVNQEVPQPKPISTKEKQPCSDRYRIYKAQKLREMLKEELRKEKKQWKNKYAINESQKPPDRSKMTMRDFIYYLPNNNPMTSSLEQEKKTEKSLTPVQTREQEGKSTPDAEGHEEVEEEVDDGPLLVPRVKVAEDGSIILDEESLTVEVLRTKGPCVVEENDPIFERGSTTTYSSFRKNYYSKPWSNKETDMFFLAISMVGTDFSMIGQLFPHRARIEIKNKFKREEKTNGWRIDKAFQEKRPFDFDFFAHLLQKVLAEEEKRKQKSVKNQSSKEKKSSKPRKNVKAKKVAIEGGNDDPDESLSSKISDTEQSQKDAQTGEEEQQSQTLSEQDSEQIALETDLNQKKKRRKNQDETGKQEVKNLSGNATVQLDHSRGEKHINNSQSLRPEMNEDEGNKEQKLSCIQNIDDIVDLSSSEKIEKRTDPILLSSGQQDATPLAAETSESSPSDLPLSEVEISTPSEVNNAESSCTEESNVDLKNKSLETDQSGSVKLMARRQLQRPKPNLSRAVGKKSVLSQGKTDAESKSLHAETSVEKNQMEKDKVNTSDIAGMEYTEKVNPETETVSNCSSLSEKIGVQDDDQTKALRPARLMRGRLQRPKPNIGKAAERKEILTSQEKIGANVKKNESESCIARDSPEQVEDQSCKNFEFEDITSQSEKEDNFFQMNVSERLSIQEDNKVPVLKTRLQKPKPNIGRGARRREVFSKEEVSEEIVASGQLTAALGEIKRVEETLPREKISLEANSTKEMKSHFKKTRRDVSPIEQIAETIDNTVEMETDLKETRGEISSRENISEVSDVIEERVTDFKETGREISSRENISEVSDVIEERVIDLKETERAVSPRENVSEMSDVTEERVTDLKETERAVSPRENVSEMSDVTEERVTDLEETGREVSPRDTISAMSDVTEERVTDLEETGREVSPRENISEVSDVTEKRVTDLKETGRVVSPRDSISEMSVVTEERMTDLEETGREVSIRDIISEISDVTEERMTDLEETGRREISLQEDAPEEVSTTDEVETGLEETGREISVRENIPEVIDVTEERETSVEETERREIDTQGKALQVKTVGEMETDWKEIGKETSLRAKVPVEISALGESEIDLEETGERDLSLMENILGKTTAIEETEADMKQSGRAISLRNPSSEISATEEMVADLGTPREMDISLRKYEAEETRTSRQMETDLMQSSSGGCSTVPSLDTKNISSEVLSMVLIPEAEKRNSEKELSGHLSSLKTSLQTLELGKTEDQGMQSPDAPEQFSDNNSSKSLPQEQKPFEVKPAPFVRSRFKRPKPNLARATLKRETTEAGKFVPGKKLETDKAETVVLQQSSEQMNTVPSQHDVASLMAAGEKDKSGHSQEEVVILPCIQTEKDLSPSSSSGPQEESQPVQAQEKELVVSMGAHNINSSQQESKESVVPTIRTVRGRLQRPRPNIRKTGQRHIEKGEAKGIVEEEKTVVQKDETKKLLAVPNSPVGTEIEVVASKVSEGRLHENQSHMVLVDPLHVNKVNVLDEKMRPEPKRYVPSPAQLTRRQFQKAKPNLGRAHGKKEELGIEKDRTDQSDARKPEDNLLQPGDDTQLLQKEKAEFLTSLDVSARKDCIDSKEAILAKKDTQSEVGPSGSVGEKTIVDNSVSSVVEVQCVSKLTSPPQLLKESSYSKIALDRRTTISSSENEVDHGGRRMHRKIKPNVTRGRGSKRMRSKTSRKEPRASKSTLVTLRASQEEDEDDAEDFEPDYEEDSYHLAPEEVNKAPVFVPIGLRSPEPVTAQIEETMEELEITVNAPDVGCIAVVEHPVSSTDVTTQQMKQEENLKALSMEMTTGEHTQDETGTNDGSTEAAITLLTMGDLVLQSEIGTEQSDGVCVLLDVHSKDKSCVPFSPDNVNHKIVRECQELSSPVSSTSPSPLEENKIVLEEQSTKEEIGLVEEVKENAISTRNTTSDVTSNLRMRSRFAKPKPNLKTLRTSRFGVHQEVPNLFASQGEVVESQTETEKNGSEAMGELQDKKFESLTTALNNENILACEHGIEEMTISQEANLTERNDDQEEESQKVQLFSVDPIVCSETKPHTLGSDMGLGESCIKEPEREDSNGDTVLTLNVSECTPSSMPEVQQENVISSQDLTVNLVANVHQGGEDEQAFILTLVEIPTNAIEEYTDTTAQLMPNPLLPAPILIKSVNTEERSDVSMSFPVTSVGQDAMCISDSGREDSEKLPANLDLITRKRFHCTLDESDHVPPAKKSSLTSRDDCQNYTSEGCSEEISVEETGESYKGQDTFPTSGSTHTTPEPQKEQLEPTLQCIGSQSLDEIIDTHAETSTPQLPQNEMIVSDKEEGTGAASKSEQMGSITAASKTPLSRPGRRPLGFLSLICSKNSLESDEPTHVYNKKRLKPFIPTLRQNLKRSNPLNESQKKTQESSDLLPSPSVVVNTESENIGSSPAQVSYDRPLPKEECKTGQTRAPEEGPTTVSEYFFSDIFIEVDET